MRKDYLILYFVCLPINFFYFLVSQNDVIDSIVVDQYAGLCIIFQAVKEAISSGVDGYDADVKKSVQKAAHGLRLTKEIAMSIASKAVSIHFESFTLKV
jgi:hypothetical protein